MIAATLSLDEARDRIWDCVVVGGGPAGSVAALEIARRGQEVLLVDRSHFPRHKVCGACLNANAVARLQRLGLHSRLEQLAGVALNEFHLRIAGRSLSLELPPGVAVTRRRLDAMLVESAIEAGADFLPGVSLNVGSTGLNGTVRHLTTGRDDALPLRTRCVVVATGLSAGRETSDPALDVVTNSNSRIGAGTTTIRFPKEYTPGTIFMAVGRSGYVGLTRTGGDELNIAAALDQKAVRGDGLQVVCKQILSESGLPATTDMLSGEWRGTIGLTRRRRSPASTRVFVIGDAAGYVEPFTGEGMSWAIRGAQAVVPFVERAVTTWDSGLIDEWSGTSRQLIGRRQGLCQVLSKLLRYPIAARGLVRIVAAMPSLGQAVIRRLNEEHGDELFNQRTG